MRSCGCNAGAPADAAKAEFVFKAVDAAGSGADAATSQQIMGRLDFPLQLACFQRGEIGWRCHGRLSL
jgi:hypothetical protein